MQRYHLRFRQQGSQAARGEFEGLIRNIDKGFIGCLEASEGVLLHLIRTNRNLYPGVEGIRGGELGGHPPRIHIQPEGVRLCIVVAQEGLGPGAKELGQGGVGGQVGSLGGEFSELRVKER